MARTRKTVEVAAAPTPLDVQASKPAAKMQPFVAPPVKQVSSEEARQSVVVEPSAQEAIDASASNHAVVEHNDSSEPTESLEDSVLAELDSNDESTVKADTVESNDEAAVNGSSNTDVPTTDDKATIYTKADASEIAQKAVRRALASKKVRGLQEENERLKAELLKMRHNDELDAISRSTGISRSLLEQSKLEGDELKSYADSLKKELTAMSERQAAEATNVAGNLLRNTVVQQSGKMDAWARLAADLAR